MPAQNATPVGPTPALTPPGESAANAAGGPVRLRPSRPGESPEALAGARFAFRSSLAQPVGEFMGGNFMATDTFMTSGPKNSTVPPRYYYQVKAVFTPSGWYPPAWTGTRQQSTLSGVFGPNPVTVGASTLPLYGWTSKVAW